MLRWLVVGPGVALGGCFGSPPGVESGSNGTSEGGSSSTSNGTNSTSGTSVTPTATADASSSESSGPSEECPPLAESGPVVVESDGQLVEFLHIVSTDGPGILINGHTGVVVRNVWIEHAGGHGISMLSANGVLIENVVIDHTGAPPEGENPSSGLNNIECRDSVAPIITNVRLSRGSAGIYLVDCHDATMSWVEGHDFRGPYPRGQLVQFDNSDRAVLEDFSVVNPAGSWPEDNVNVTDSFEVEIRRGVIDGNNSQAGVGVSFSGPEAIGIVEDVDAIRMGNGCFSDFAGADGVVFRRTRCRENICEDQGRGAPLSNGLMWSGQEGYSAIRIEDSAYFAPCNPKNVWWPDGTFEVFDLIEEDFTMNDPLTLEFCWE